ncbi:MAG: hypothetical protein NVS4B12_22930 [Ktedonobacteraceae bacterium]
MCYDSSIILNSDMSSGQGEGRQIKKPFQFLIGGKAREPLFQARVA